VLTPVDKQKEKKESTLELMIFSAILKKCEKHLKWGFKRKNPPFSRSWWEETLVLNPFSGVKVGNE
jgi:hypothetical protein